MKKTQHYRSLDGLRGLAALLVVFLHYVSAFAPFIIGLAVTQRHSRFDHIVATTPLQLPFAGNFAVCIFFVLSGFVLSLRYLQTKDNGVLVSSAARRFFRLMLPAFGSVILAYIVLRAGLIYTHQAALGGESSSWLATFWNFPAHLGQAFFQAIYGIWFGTASFNTTTSYNVVLWTMHFELFGSFLVFMFLALLGKLPNRWLFYAIFAMVFIKTYYLCFIAGMVINDLLITWPALKDKLNQKLVWFSLPVGIFLGTWNTDSIYKSVYSHLSAPFFTAGQIELLAHMIGAIIIVTAVLKLEMLSRVLETRPFQYLGKVSFALYLTHFIVLSSVASFVFYRALPVYGYKLAVLGAAAVGLPLSFVVASLYTKFVDIPSIAASKRLGNWLLDGKWPALRARLPLPGLIRKEEGVVEEAAG